MSSAAEAKLKPITMYGMRHSFASNLLIAGVSDVKVSRWLGHSDTRMVHKHYGHLLSYDDDINAHQRGVRVEEFAPRPVGSIPSIEDVSDLQAT